MVVEEEEIAVGSSASIHPEICKGTPFTSGIPYSIPHISDLETLDLSINQFLGNLP